MPIHRQGLALLVAAFTKKSIRGIFRQEYNITITKSRHDFGYKRGDISNPMSQRKDWSEKSRNGTQYFSKLDIPKSSCCIPPGTKYTESLKESVLNNKAETKNQRTRTIESFFLLMY
jgi:hypothetical protein